MTALLLIGDVHERMAQLEDHSFDLIITSPPFLALRSYLPDDHPQKHLEIGSEATPAAYLDVLLALTAEWRRLLAPHGSIAVELGDTYAGSGGAGGDYNPDGLRDGQPRFRQVISREHRPEREGTGADGGERMVPTSGGNGWPLDKSLCGIPTLYAWSLAYGRNLLTGQESPAGRWRIRNLKPWIRTNPPVGALGDKERPATSYVTVATLARDRWFDLDAVRTAAQDYTPRRTSIDRTGIGGRGDQTMNPVGEDGNRVMSNPAGAPPLDWWHQTDAIIDDELQQRARDSQRPNTTPRGNNKRNEAPDGNWGESFGDWSGNRPAVKGTHIRRRLEKAGILPPHPDALDISPRGYSGAHYAVWAPELVRQLVDEMCPRRVCVTCGEPSRRISSVSYEATTERRNGSKTLEAVAGGVSPGHHAHAATNPIAHRETLGWSDCGHNTWRSGRILDPFSGSGTTLAVVTGMGRDAVGIDLDRRNAHLTEQRCGMFLTVDWGTSEPTDELPPADIIAQVAEEML